MEKVLFLFCALGMISGGLALILNRNPITAILALILVFIIQAVLYVLLNAPFIAILQVIVYAGAIMVLFIFVVMLLNLRERPLWDQISKGRKMLATLVGLGLWLLLLGVATKLSITTKGPLPPDFGSPQRVGEVLFQQYLLPFELIALLLLIAIVAVMALLKRGQS